MEPTHVNLNDQTLEGLGHTPPAGLQRPVPPRGLGRPARQPVPVRRVPPAARLNHRRAARPRSGRSARSPPDLTSRAQKPPRRPSRNVPDDPPGPVRPGRPGFDPGESRGILRFSTPPIPPGFAPRPSRRPCRITLSPPIGPRGSGGRRALSARGPYYGRSDDDPSPRPWPALGPGAAPRIPARRRKGGSPQVAREPPGHHHRRQRRRVAPPGDPRRERQHVRERHRFQHRQRAADDHPEDAAAGHQQPRDDRRDHPARLRRAPLIQINGSQIFDPNASPPNTYPLGNVSGLVVAGGNSTIRGLDINRFTGPGIYLGTGGHDVVAGNYIGTDLSGTNALGNGSDGVFIAGSRFNVIGGTSAADRNVISGNAYNGVEINSNSYNSQYNAGNIVEGNIIGADVSGTIDLANGADGVAVFNSSANVVGGNAPGASNLIAYNGGSGIRVSGYYYYTPQPLGTQITSNSIFANIGPGITLGTAAAIPVVNAQLTSAYLSGTGTDVEGSFAGTPGASYLVQFFSTPASEASYSPQGKTLIAQQTYTADGGGLVRFSTVLGTAVPIGEAISATATDSNQTTSAFFGAANVASGPSADLGVTVVSSPRR